MALNVLWVCQGARHKDSKRSELKLICSLGEKGLQVALQKIENQRGDAHTNKEAALLFHLLCLSGTGVPSGLLLISVLHVGI